jgi:histone-lysine N-methyltransferase SETMAR
MEIKKQVRNYPDFLSKVITGEGSWIYGYDPETKQQSSQWKCPSLPRPMKERQVKSNVKSMQICFFNIDGIICKESLPPCQTVNAKFYCDVLKRLRENMRRKRPDKWRTNNWLLHQDKAPAHTALAVQQFLASKNITVVPHPPYSPDLAPCDFFFFPKTKIKLKGQRFDTVEEIQAESQKVLKMQT